MRWLLTALRLLPGCGDKAGARRTARQLRRLPPRPALPQHLEVVERDAGGQSAAREDTSIAVELSSRSTRRQVRRQESSCAPGTFCPLSRSCAWATKGTGQPSGAARRGEVSGIATANRGSQRAAEAGVMLTA